MAGGNSSSPLSTTASSNNSRATEARWLHVILLTVGLAGWMIFILACVGGPVWSPDGSQILFAYRDVENSRTAVALYDRRTRKTTTIFALPAAKEGELALEPRWQKDGTRALIAAYQVISGSLGKGFCTLISIPVKSAMPLQAYPVGNTEGCLTMGSYPQLDGKVYFGGDDLRWVDTVTGEITTKDIPNGVGDISERNGLIFYMRESSRDASDAKGKATVENGMEFGRIDLKEFTLKPDFTLWKSDTAPLGITGDLSPVFWETNGPGMAVIAKDYDANKILFLDQSKGIVRVLVPDLGVSHIRLRNLVWARDGKTLYASAFAKGDQEETWEYFLAEIPVGGTFGRLTKLATIHGEMNDDLDNYMRASLQVSLSPDGSLIAATPAIFGKDRIAERDRALFLIDVRDPARPITRIPIPIQSSPAPPAAKASK